MKDWADEKALELWRHSEHITSGSLEAVAQALREARAKGIEESERLPPDHVAIEMRLKIPGNAYEYLLMADWCVKDES